MDSSLVRGSMWIVAALLAVLAIGWAGTGGCAGTANGQLRADVDALASRVQTLEGRVRKLEGGGGGAKATRGVGKAKGKGSKLPGGAKAKGTKADGKAPADGADPALARGKAKGVKAPAPAATPEGQVPPG